MDSPVVSAAILLGASVFPRHSFPVSEPFLRTKQDLQAYLMRAQVGLGLSDAAVLDLFDSPRHPGEQLVAIGEFLDRLVQTSGQGALRNLLVYYVGHGLFPSQR
jgi:hypothetical protein